MGFLSKSSAIQYYIEDESFIVLLAGPVIHDSWIIPDSPIWPASFF
jgi:hypothetical protein